MNDLFVIKDTLDNSFFQCFNMFGTVARFAFLNDTSTLAVYTTEQGANDALKAVKECMGEGRAVDCVQVVNLKHGI